ncbi:GGDEF domain-containing protein, partial [Pseudarthrobacter sp. AG30]
MRPPTPAEVLPSLPDDFEWPAHVSRGAPALLAYLDLEQRFRFANDTHRRWLGIDPQRLIGRRLIDVVGRRNHELAGAALERAYAGHMASYEGELYNGHERRYAHGNFQPD